jgi:hypothetical protein
MYPLVSTTKSMHVVLSIHDYLLRILNEMVVTMNYCYYRKGTLGSKHIHFPARFTYPSPDLLLELM